MHKRFGELIDWANNHYDIVILDTLQFLQLRTRRLLVTMQAQRYLLPDLNLIHLKKLR
jgi:hypothetical protein